MRKLGVTTRFVIATAAKAILAATVALLSWELVLRNALTDTPRTSVHPVLGRIYDQGRYLHGTEGFSRTTINSLGLRGAEPSSKGDLEFRILALGDSHTTAFQVADGETYCDVLEAALTRRMRRPVRVINAGRSGASPAAYIHLGQYYRASLQPDLVIVQVTDADFSQDMLNAGANFYVVPVKDAYRTVRNEKYGSSNSFRRMFPILDAMTEFSVARIAGDNLDKLYKARLSDGKPPAGRAAAEDTAGKSSLIAWTMRELAKTYPACVVLYVPTIDYLASDLRPSEMERLIVANAAKASVPLVNMRRNFVDAFLANRQPLHGFDNSQPGTGHTNARGHALMGERLADFVDFRFSKK